MIDALNQTRSRKQNYVMHGYHVTRAFFFSLLMCNASLYNHERCVPVSNPVIESHRFNYRSWVTLGLRYHRKTWFPRLFHQHGLPPSAPAYNRASYRLMEWWDRRAVCGFTDRQSQSDWLGSRAVHRGPPEAAHHRPTFSTSALALLSARIQDFFLRLSAFVQRHLSNISFMKLHNRG